MPSRALFNGWPLAHGRSTAPVALSISGANGTANVGDTASFTPTISGGTAPYTVAATGLPPGRAIQTPSTGLTTGAYTTAGSYSATYTATDSSTPQQTASFTRSVVVSAAVALMNIATSGGLPSAQGTVSGSLTRQKGRKQYAIPVGATSLRVSFANSITVAGTGGETANASAITVQKVSVVYNGQVAPLPFSGARSGVMAAGALEFATDEVTTQSLFGLASLPDNAVIEVRWMLDVPASGTFPAIEGNRDFSYLSSTSLEQAYIYDPSVTPTDDIDATGALSAPSGATASGYGVGSALYTKPAMISGRTTRVAASVQAEVDSIGSGTGAAGSDGSATAIAKNPGASGGWVRQRLQAANVAFLINGVSSRALAHYAGGNAMAKNYMKYHTGGLVELVTNDVNSSGQTQAAITTNRRQVYSDMTAAGIKKIVHATAGVYATSTNRFYDLTNQTVQTTPSGAWPAGGKRDLVNTDIRNDAGQFNLSNYIDYYAVVADATATDKWKKLPEWTLNTATTTGTSVTMSLAGSVAPLIGDALTLDPTGTPFPTSASQVLTVATVTGSGPWTVTVNGFVNVAKAVGTIVEVTPTTDGLHPSPTNHRNVANDTSAHGAVTVLTAANMAP